MNTATRQRTTRAAAHAIVLGALWWVLTGGAPESWVVGLPAVLAISVVSSARLERIRLRPLGVLRFAGFFALQSVSAGVDVARRIVVPSLAIDPALVVHDFRLSAPAARVFMAGVVTLLPGTLSATLRGDSLRVHVLDRAMPFEPTLARLERRVAAVFGEELDDG
ncbi:MAG TPA: Na+/H+ antiporter subunit E [Pelomicrobium sp.]|nr:Na+/H+ antiporter subunit E [Pelomicrobium sp.]